MRHKKNRCLRIHNVIKLRKINKMTTTENPKAIRRVMQRNSALKNSAAHCGCCKMGFASRYRANPIA